MANQILPVIFRPSLAMNSDLDPLAPRGGSSIDNLNVGELTQGGGTTTAIEPKKGNTLAYTLPTVTTQDKIYRVFLDSSQTTPTQRDLKWYDANSVLEATASYTPTSGNLAATYATAIAAINTAYGAGNLTLGALVTTSTNQGYFSLHITVNPTWDYTIVLVGAVDEELPMITQEAIDTSLSGPLQHIGSFDLNGDLFIWSTTQTELPSEINITNVTGAAGVIRITVDEPITNFSAITVSGVTGTTEANGTWIVNRISALVYDLLGSAFSNAYTGGGVVTINVKGLGEIGVAVKDWNDGTWTYTTLLRSTEFNFRTQKQPKTDGERNNINASLYWTDNYNVPRVFYYKGDYITNGALNYIDSENIYFYGSIAEEVKLIQNTNNFTLEWVSQDQTGGGVLAGNHRYAIRLLTENLVATPTTDVTNPVPVFNPSTTNAVYKIGGNDAYTQTGKINNLEFTNPNPNVFKWVELIDIYYANGVPVGTIVRRDLLTQEPTQTIQHTGLELDSQTFDLAQLSSVPVDIATALNLAIVDNHLVLSNLTTNQVLDFTDWAQTFEHAVKADSTISTVGIGFTTNYLLGEYANPVNVYNKAGYMHNEIYRFGVKLKLKNGFVTEAFWVDDIRIDTIANNDIANPTSNRRIGALTNYNLTNILDSSGYGNLNVAYIEFSNIDLEYLIDGVPLRDLVDEIIFERVDISQNEALRDVLGTGVIIKTVANEIFNTAPLSPPQSYWGNTNVNDNNNYTISPDDLDGGGGPYADPYLNFFEYYGASEWFMTPLGDTYAETGTNHVSNPFYAFFYSPDNLFGQVEYALRASDVVVNYGSAARYFTQQPSALATAAVMLPSSFSEYDGAQGMDWSSVQLITLDNMWDVVEGGTQVDGANTFYKTAYYCRFTAFTYGPTFREYNPPSPLQKSLSSTVNGVPSVTYFDDVNALGNTDYGMHYVQYMRPRGSGIQKYGEPRLSSYIPTGYAYEITPDSPAVITTGTTTIFGGDVFTQKTYVKNRAPSNNPDPSFDLLGGGSGIGFYSQNRANTQLKNSAPGNQHTAWDMPYLTPAAWTESLDPAYQIPVYNTGYNILQGVTEDPNFDPTVVRSTHLPARIQYSDVKPENSAVDNYRVFLPLNFKDLELSAGEITHHLNLNGQLLTWQPLHYMFQYFDTTGILTTSAGEATLGNAGIMNRKGNVMSTYGTKHGFSVIVGKSKGGKQTAYWIDTVHGKVMRWQESNGSVCISDDHNMRWFFNNYLTYADLANTPADGTGICGVWDDQNSEAIWTVRAHKSVDDWDADTTYGLYDEVFYQPATYSTFEQTGEIYISKVANNTALPTDTDSWELVEHFNPSDVLVNGQHSYDYYNEFTITYNEVKDTFTTRYSYLPKIYLKLGKTFLAPRPVEFETRAYEFYTKDSEYCVWFKADDAVTSDTEQAVNWFVSGMIVNEAGNIDKRAMAMEWMTNTTPYKVYIDSKKYSTFMTRDVFEARGDYYICSVQNNLLNGANDADESFIFGSYFSVKLEGIPREYNNLYNFILKMLIKSRTFTS